MKPKYLRQIGTNKCFAYSDHLVKRKDIVPWVGPLPFEVKELTAPEKKAIEKNPVDPDRFEKILEVVKGFDPSEYTTAPGKLPAPKVKDVSAKFGEKVSVDEVQAAMKQINAESEGQEG